MSAPQVSTKERKSQPINAKAIQLWKSCVAHLYELVWGCQWNVMAPNNMIIFSVSKVNWHINQIFKNKKTKIKQVNTEKKNGGQGYILQKVFDKYL